jgi:hypothetical protein
MDVVVTWICLGGGIVMMLLALVLIRRLQSRTLRRGESEPDLD